MFCWMGVGRSDLSASVIGNMPACGLWEVVSRVEVERRGREERGGKGSEESRNTFRTYRIDTKRMKEIYGYRK